MLRTFTHFISKHLVSLIRGKIMKEQQNQFRSQNGGVYSTSSTHDEVIKFDTLKRDLDNRVDNDSVGVLHASLIHANNSVTDV